MLFQLLFTDRRLDAAVASALADCSATWLGLTHFSHLEKWEGKREKIVNINLGLMSCIGILSWSFILVFCLSLLFWSLIQNSWLWFLSFTLVLSTSFWSCLIATPWICPSFNKLSKLILFRKTNHQLTPCFSPFTCNHWLRQSSSLTSHEQKKTWFRIPFNFAIPSRWTPTKKGSFFISCHKSQALQFEMIWS